AVCSAHEHPLGDVAGSWRAQHFFHPRRTFGRVPIERSLQKTFLVSKRCIEARRVDAHRLGQFRDGGALIAMSPEDLHRLIKRGIGVEFSRATHGHSRYSLQPTSLSRGVRLL